MDICKSQAPPSIPVAPGHVSACWLHVNPASRDASGNGVPATAGGATEKEIKR